MDLLSLVEDRKTSRTTLSETMRMYTIVSGRLVPTWPITLIKNLTMLFVCFRVL